MNERRINKIIEFVNICEVYKKNNQLPEVDLYLCHYYLNEIRILSKLYSDDNYTIFKTLEIKLKMLINSSLHNKRASQLISQAHNYNVAEYITYLVKTKRITDKKLIARFVYLELSKSVYYNISIRHINDQQQVKELIETPCECDKLKMFSYVVCTQFTQLYKYILEGFGIKVDMIVQNGHTWGQIELDEKEIIIADATDYIKGSIDLSCAKSVSPTKGFLILPAEFKGIRVNQFYQDKNNCSWVNICNHINRELDVSLGVIDRNGYIREIIIKDNEIFNSYPSYISSDKEKCKYLEKVKYFFYSLPLPNNIDGYEDYAYYYGYLSELPEFVRANFELNTLYVDSMDYKLKRIKSNKLIIKDEYRHYIEAAYYNFLYERLRNSKNDSFIPSIARQDFEKAIQKAVEDELKEAEINRRIAPYYAINVLRMINPFASDFPDYYLLHEPLMGKRLIKSFDEYKEFKIDNKIY